MDLVRYVAKNRTVIFMDLDVITKALIKDDGILCYTEKGIYKVQEIKPGYGAARVRQALVLKSRILPNVNTKAEN